MQMFNDLTIIDLIVGLTDLLNETPTEERPVRVTALALVDGDRIYRGQLAQLLTALKALPPGEQGLPLSELLKAADGSFDRKGRLLRAVREMLTLLEDPTPAATAAAQSLAQIVPAGITQASYAAEAQHAGTVQASLETHRAGLEAVPLPDTQTPTALAVVERFIAAGLELDRLASNRGEAVATRGDRAGAAPLRSKTLGTLHALREHVARARESRADLPSDLDAKIFGYLDELQRWALGRDPGAPANPVSPVGPVTPVTPAGPSAPTT